MPTGIDLLAYYWHSLHNLRKQRAQYTERAKVVLFEDDADVRILARMAMSYTPHELVSEASSQLEALETVERVAAGELEVDVFLFDGRLSPTSGAGEDARIIHDYIKALRIDGTTLGFSIEPMATDRCDVYVPN